MARAAGERDPLVVKRQQVWAQGSAALVTLWLGIEMGGPWWAAVIVALLVAVTTFATRRPSHDHSVRSDELGRQVCVCPAGQPPPHWLALTSQERRALVEPPPPPPDGTLEPGHAGFTPRNVRVGFTIESP